MLATAGARRGPRTDRRWELPEVTEPCLVGEFPRLRLAHRGPDAGTALSERCRHAVEGADRVEKLPERVDVLLHPRRAAHLEEEVRAARHERTADAGHQPHRIDGVMHDVERRD